MSLALKSGSIFNNQLVLDLQPLEYLEILVWNLIGAVAIGIYYRGQKGYLSLSPKTSSKILIF